MIKSKIDARERALELAIEWRKAMPNSMAETTESMADRFAIFLIGSADLPEVDSLKESVTEMVEIFQKSMPQFNKPNEGSATEFLLPASPHQKLIIEEEVEDFKAMLIERGYIDESVNIIFGNGDNFKKSFNGFDLRLYVNKRVGGYVVSSSMSIGEGFDAPRFTLPDYDLDIDRIESAALKLYGCYCDTTNLEEGA